MSPRIGTFDTTRFIPATRQGFYIPQPALSLEIQGKLSEVPGTEYDKGDIAYPYNMRGLIEAEIGKCDWSKADDGFEWEGAFKMHPHQNEVCSEILKHSAWFIAFEPGVGKTHPAIAAMEQEEGYKLVVCPAMVIDEWESHIERLAKDPSLYKVTSYERVAQVAETLHQAEFFGHDTLGGITSICLDESHYIKNYKTQRTNVLFELRNLCKELKLKIALTGTPITDQPKDLYRQLTWLNQHAWGKEWPFYERYCNIEKGKYGKKITGINPDRAEELNLRLQYACSRVTSDEVSHLFPPLTTSTMMIEKPKGWRAKDFLETFDRPDLHRAKFDRFLLRTSDARVEAAADLAVQKLKTGRKHVLIFTFHRETAEQIEVAVYGRGAKAWHIHGEMTKKQRNRSIKACEAEGGVICATMHSCGTGINTLAYMNEVIFAELYYTPTPIIQAMARVRRVGGKGNKHVTFIIARGTIDEIMVQILKPKLENSAMLIKAGASDAKVAKMLETTKSDEKTILKRLREVREVEEDEYS